MWSFVVVKLNIIPILWVVIAKLLPVPSGFAPGFVRYLRNLMVVSVIQQLYCIDHHDVMLSLNGNC